MNQETVTPQQAPAPPTPGVDSTPPTKKGVPLWFKVVIITVGVFIVLGVGGFVALFYFVGHATKDAEKVSNQLVSNVQSDSPTAAYALTSPEFQKATSVEDLDMAIESVSPLLQGETTVTERKLIKDDGRELVVLVYSVATDKGTKYLRVTVEKVDDQWKVLNFRASEKQLPAEID